MFCTTTSLFLAEHTPMRCGGESNVRTERQGRVRTSNGVTAVGHAGTAPRGSAERCQTASDDGRILTRSGRTRLLASYARKTQLSASGPDPDPDPDLASVCVCISFLALSHGLGRTRGGGAIGGAPAGLRRPVGQALQLAGGGGNERRQHAPHLRAVTFCCWKLERQGFPLRLCFTDVAISWDLLHDFQSVGPQTLVRPRGRPVYMLNRMSRREPPAELR